MDLAQLNPFFGWAAYLSAAATMATAITGVLFFTQGERFGKINDAASVVQMLFTLPVAVGLYPLIRQDGDGLALLATGIGVSGMLVAAVLQALLVISVVKYEQTVAAVLGAGGAIGAWLVLANVLALAAQTLPGSLAIAGIATGVGYVLLAIGFRIGGQEHPLSYAGALLALVGYSIWSIWLGTLFTSSAVAP